MYMVRAGLKLVLLVIHIANVRQSIHVGILFIKQVFIAFQTVAWLNKIISTKAFISYLSCKHVAFGLKVRLTTAIITFKILFFNLLLFLHSLKRRTDSISDVIWHMIYNVNLYFFQKYYFAISSSLLKWKQLYAIWYKYNSIFDAFPSFLAIRRLSKQENKPKVNCMHGISRVLTLYDVWLKSFYLGLVHLNGV